jgi:hypothetical protein
VPVYWLASDLRYVVNSLVPVCWLASDLKSVVNSLVPVFWSSRFDILWAQES